MPDRPRRDPRSEHDPSTGPSGSADPAWRPEYRSDNYDGLRPEGENDDDD